MLRILACDPEELEAGVQELGVLGDAAPGEGAAVATSGAQTRVGHLAPGALLQQQVHTAWCQALAKPAA